MRAVVHLDLMTQVDHPHLGVVGIDKLRGTD
jgi:hypothetical protein